MKIETKFSPNDKVWVIFEGKAKEFPVNSIKTDTEISGVSEISYFVNIGTEKDYKCKIFYEAECFKTKEDLLNFVSNG